MIILIPIAVWMIAGKVAAGCTLLAVVAILFTAHMTKD